MDQTRPLGPPMNTLCTGQLGDLWGPVEGGMGWEDKGDLGGRGTQENHDWGSKLPGPFIKS